MAQQRGDMWWGNHPKYSKAAFKTQEEAEHWELHGPAPVKEENRSNWYGEADKEECEDCECDPCECEEE